MVGAFAILLHSLQLSDTFQWNDLYMELSRLDIPLISIYDHLPSKPFHSGYK